MREHRNIGAAIASAMQNNINLAVAAAESDAWRQHVTALTAKGEALEGRPA